MNSLQKSYQHCQQITQYHAKTFYFASHTLAPQTRQGAYAIYAFCRQADDAVDLASSDTARKTAVAEFHEKLNQVYNTQVFDSQKDTWIEAFAHTVHSHAIPRVYFEELLEGMMWDQGRVRLQTWEELDRYCYLVAGVVGVIMTHLFCQPTPFLLERAKHLGTAMQLTNILRDVREDEERDRIYLPESELREWKIDSQKLSQLQDSESWKEFMKFQIQRARDYYQKSETGIQGLPSGGIQKTVWLMRILYSEILVQIENQNYNVYQSRARVSFFRKVRLAAQWFLTPSRF